MNESFTKPHTWGQRLLSLLRRKGMTQKELADLVEVSETTVSKWTKGKGITDEKLDEICAILGTTRAWLKWGEDVFKDEIWMEDSEMGGEAMRRLLNGPARLELSAEAEATLGFIMWSRDDDARVWIWSGHAEKLFAMPEPGPHEKELPLANRVTMLMDRRGNRRLCACWTTSTKAA